MSRYHQITINCPECGRSSPFTIWDSINTTLNPEMKPAVLDRSAFLFKCPYCKAKTYIDYGLLYHQMKDRIMIFYANTDENVREIYKLFTGTGADDMIMDMRKENYLLRAVRSQRELIEKITIFDHGLDDRIIEIFKLYVLAMVRNDHPEYQEKNVDIFYFHDSEANDYIEIDIDGHYIGYTVMPKETYDKMCEEYKSVIQDMRKDGPCINRQWALETWGRCHSDQKN